MFLVVVESIGLPIFALFFNLRAGFYLLPLALILALGSLCLSAEPPTSPGLAASTA